MRHLRCCIFVLSALLTAATPASVPGDHEGRAPRAERAEEAYSHAAPGEIVVKLQPGQPFGAEHLRLVLGEHGLASREIAPVFSAAHDALRRGLTDEQFVAETLSRLHASSPRRNLPVAPRARGLGNVYKIRLEGEGADLEELALRLAEDARFHWAEPNYRVRELLVPNDPYWATTGSWGQAYDDLWGLKRIGCESAWDTTTGGSGIVVGVVDSGIDYNHADLASKIWTNPGEIPGNSLDDDGNGFVDDVQGWDFCTYGGNVRDNDPMDDRGHGTHVAGTIAAASNNGTGVTGVAWGPVLMPVRGLDVSGSGWTTDLAEGVVYAADNGASVINNSWGGWGWSAPQVLVDAVTHAHDLGVVVVAAAGNSAADALTAYPAHLKEVITVSAFTPSDTRASFSNWGVKIDVAAPGDDVLSCLAAGSWHAINSPGQIVGGTYLRLGGTSMAAPHVAGVAALVLSANPGYTNEEVRHVLRVSAEDVTAPGWDTDSGYGMLDADQALGVSNPLVATIDAPGHRTFLSGIVNVSGTASGTKLQRYRVEYGVGQTPSSWTLVTQSNSEVVADLLATWDTSALADGEYTLRLAAEVKGSSTEYHDRVVVWKDAALRAGWPVDIGGPAYSNPALADVDGLAGHEVVLGHPFGSNEEAEGRYAAYTHTGALAAPSWPQSTIDPVANSAAIGDIDLDGTLEIVGTSMGFRMLYAWEPDGTPAGPPFPVDVSRNTYIFKWGGYVSDQSPVLADVDGDPELEILFLSVGQVWAVDPDGSVLPGWPVTLLTLPNLKAIIDAPALAVGDLDADGLNEIVAVVGFEDSTFPYDRHSTVHVLNHDGTPMTGSLWPVSTTTMPISTSGPTLGDIDGDGDLEVLAGGLSIVHAWHHDGSVVTGWPATVGNWVMTDPVLSDLDGDGMLEALVLTTSHRIHAFNHDGTERFQRVATMGGNPHPVVGDIDGDGQLEIVAGGFYGDLYAWNHENGLSLPGWPKKTLDLISTSAALGDLDGDLVLDAMAGSKDSRLYAWDLGVPYDASTMEWPVYRQSTHRTGRYVPPGATCGGPPADVAGLDVAASPERVTWQALGAGVRYDVVGGSAAALRGDGGTTGASCLAVEWVDATWGDARPDPPPGEAYYYLVRARNACGAGGYGVTSSGSGRTVGADCPQ